MQSSFLSPAGKFRIFAHRGSQFDAHGNRFTENTIEAFACALELGADCLEIDVQASSDGIAVVFHDADLDRLAGDKRRVSQLTAAELGQVRLNHGGRISTLREVLSHFPDAKFNIDVKAKSAAHDVKRTIQDLGATDRVLITSFSARRRRLAELPGVATSGSATTLLCIWLLLLIRSPIGFLTKSVNALQIPVKYGPIRFDSPRFIKSVTDLGVEVHFWVVNDPLEAERLEQLGANGVVTDETEKLVAALAE